MVEKMIVVVWKFGSLMVVAVVVVTVEAVVVAVVVATVEAVVMAVAGRRRQMVVAVVVVLRTSEHVRRDRKRGGREGGVGGKTKSLQCDDSSQ